MKRIARLLAVALLMAAPSVARADPILTPLIISASSGALGATIAGTGLSYAAIISSAVVSGAPVGPSRLVRAQ